ncbi:MAG TPA: type II secretion system F family protein [Acidimicrobiales bacterium]|nr:type II secretion system F family protein [Acidimicrobiales bacterium]
MEALGRTILRLDPRHRHRRRPAPARAPARRAGAVALVAAATAAVAPALAPAVVFAAWAAPKMRVRREGRRRLAALEAGLPEIVDLLTLAVGAGANVTHAVAAAGRRGAGPLAGELARITNEAARGRRVADALDELPERAGEATRPLVVALSACERYGAPLVPALERLGDEVRRQRQRRAEEAARKVPVLLLFPLVLCILPAFALLTVAPLVAGALRALRL